MSLPGIAVLIFIESGVLFPFLPGDSLLVTAAITSAALGIAPWQVAVVASIAAVAGDQVGYWIGRRFGRRLFRDGARVLTTARLDEAEAFFTRWGGLSLVLGRFVPVVRTYVPLAAGTADMHYRRFILWNIVGAIGLGVRTHRGRRAARRDPVRRAQHRRPHDRHRHRLDPAHPDRRILPPGRHAPAREDRSAEGHVCAASAEADGREQ